MSFIRKLLGFEKEERRPFKCEYCGEFFATIYKIKDTEGGDTVYRQACEACREEQRGEMGTSRAIVPVPQPATTSITYCKMCHAVAEKGKSYCKKCGAFIESLEWWSEHYTPKQRFWSQDPYALAKEYNMKVKDVVHEFGLWYIDIDKLRQYCTAPEEWFWTLPGAVKVEVGTAANTSEYTFIDNGADILFVGHLDKSRGSLDRNIFTYYEADKSGKHYVHNGNLDDREGVFIGHYLLPTQFGITFDYLFTTDEETGGSTAEEFQRDWLALPEEKRKKYKWIIEFDRHGLEPVMYEFEDKDLREKIEEFIKTTKGSFTDICKLSKMGCKAINWSTGYYSEHTPGHYAIMEDMVKVIEAFVGFYRKYKDVHLPHTHTSYSRNQSWNWENGYNSAAASVHRSSYEQIECPRCSRKVYSVHRFDLEIGLSIEVCWKCKKEMEEGAEFFTEENGWFKCSVCGENHEVVIIDDDKEMCMSCFKKAQGLAKKELDPEGGCSNCHKFFENYYEKNGEWLCHNCYNPQSE